MAKIDHIGIAVNSLESALYFYRDLLGLEYQGEETLVEEALRAAFLGRGEARIELLSPLSDESKLSKFLKNRGQGLHHICYQVKDLQGVLKKMEEKGVELIDKKPRRGAHGRSVAFIHPKSASGVLIELVEIQAVSPE